MENIKMFDKRKSIVEPDYVWLSSSDNELFPILHGVEIEGVLQLDKWNSSIVDFIKSNAIEGLELKGDRFENTSYSISFLEELTELKYLRISGKFNKTEYKVIESLKGLEELILADYEGYNLDFSNFKYLKSYFSPIKHNDHPIFECENILYIGSNTNLDDFYSFSRLKNLRSVYMTARNLKGLSGIESLKYLEELEIDYGFKLQDISSLSKTRQLSRF